MGEMLTQIGDGISFIVEFFQYIFEGVSKVISYLTLCLPFVGEAIMFLPGGLVAGLTTILALCFVFRIIGLVKGAL